MNPAPACPSPPTRALRLCALRCHHWHHRDSRSAGAGLSARAAGTWAPVALGIMIETGLRWVIGLDMGILCKIDTGIATELIGTDICAISDSVR